MSGIYIHIPFCRHACSYCNFYFSTQQKLIDDFVEALITEIQQRPFPIHLLNEPIQTLYFGGGTPSLLPLESVNRIKHALQNRFDLATLKECTFEMNPENAEPPYLLGLKKLGINRLSMGIQSFQPWILRHMHRSHMAEQAMQAFEAIKSANFASYSVDLIYAYPGESLEELEADLNQFIAMNPPHISAYNLTLEEGTRLEAMLKKEQLKVADEDTQQQHSELVRVRLEQAGYNAYEVSNFAKAAHEARHNAAYWEHRNYLAFGPGAHGFGWDESGRSAQRWAIPANLEAYIQQPLLAYENQIHIPLTELAEERLMLGLRTQKGVDLGQLKATYDYILSKKQLEIIDWWQKEGILDTTAIQKQLFRLSPKGRLLTDHLAYKLITA